jgi:hypothetical protein
VPIDFRNIEQIQGFLHKVQFWPEDHNRRHVYVDEVSGFGYTHHELAKLREAVEKIPSLK